MGVPRVPSDVVGAVHDLGLVEGVHLAEVFVLDFVDLRAIVVCALQCYVSFLDLDLRFCIFHLDETVSEKLEDGGASCAHESWSNAEDVRIDETKLNLVVSVVLVIEAHIDIERLWRWVFRDWANNLSGVGKLTIFEDLVALSIREFDLKLAAVIRRTGEVVT